MHMNELKKRRFRTVEAKEMDYKQKIRAHRLRVARLISIIILVLILAIVGVFLYFRFKEYNDYSIIKSQTMETVSEAEYLSYADGVLKVSRDGAIYFNYNGQQIWNQTYEMNQPIVDICGKYVVIGSLKGNNIYILNDVGLQGEIKAESPIRAVEVSERGTVAILLEGESSYKIVLYDKKSTLLAQGEFRIENTGYPIAISLSADGVKLGVSFVSIDGGEAGARIQFYNYGSVGQNEIDNLVSKYEYEGTIIPQIEFLNENVMVAYGTNQVILYDGEEKPQEKQVINMTEEIKTIFYNDKYYGVTYDVIESIDNQTQAVHEVIVYDLFGEEVLRQQFTEKYERVLLLEDRELAIVRDNQCTIYTFDGVKRFQSELGNNIFCISKGKGLFKYTFFMQGELIDIRLK